MSNFRFGFILAVLLGFTGLTFHTLQAQEVLGKEKIKKFPTEAPWVYPVDLGDLDGNHMYISFNPALKLNSGEFIHVWNPERTRFKERRVSKYNILQELMWEVSFEVEEQEDLDYIFTRGDRLYILGSIGKRYSKEQMIMAHVVSLDSGKIEETRILRNERIKSDQTLFFDASPDGSKLLYYYFQHENPGTSTRANFNYIRQDNRLGYRYRSVSKVHLLIYDQNLDLLRDTVMNNVSKKSSIMDCQIDDAGNVYLLSYEKPSLLRGMQYNFASGKQRNLTHEEFLRPSEMYNRFNTRMPAFIGSDQKMYLPVADRKSTGRGRGTKAYEMVCFDFQKDEVDLNRRININSGLQIEIEKQRKQLGLRPLKRFDEFLMRDIFETKDQSLWFLVQKFEASNLENPQAGNYWEEDVDTYELGEFILFQFSPDGKPVKALIIPGYQRISGFMERLFFDYHLQIDKEKGKIYMLTYEPSEQKFRGPERIFWREINLEDGNISSKVKIFDGDRRYQFLVKPYTVWLNEDLLSFIVIEGENGSAYRVSVNLKGEAEEEEGRKGRKKKKNSRGF